jgi:hypothetical protein
MGNQQCGFASKGIKTDKPRSKRRPTAKGDLRPEDPGMFMKDDRIEMDTIQDDLSVHSQKSRWSHSRARNSVQKPMEIPTNLNLSAKRPHQEPENLEHDITFSSDHDFPHQAERRLSEPKSHIEVILTDSWAEILREDCKARPEIRANSEIFRKNEISEPMSIDEKSSKLEPALQIEIYQEKGSNSTKIETSDPAQTLDENFELAHSTDLQPNNQPDSDLDEKVIIEITTSIPGLNEDSSERISWAPIEESQYLEESEVLMEVTEAKMAQINRMDTVKKHQGSLDCIEEMGSVENETSSISKKNDLKENVIGLSEGSEGSDFLMKREKFGKLKADLGEFEKARSKSNVCNESPFNGGRLEDWAGGKSKNNSTTWDMYGESLSKMEIACDDG